MSPGFTACDCAADRVPLPVASCTTPTADGLTTASSAHVVHGQKDQLPRLGPPRAEPPLGHHADSQTGMCSMPAHAHASQRLGNRVRLQSTIARWNRSASDVLAFRRMLASRCADVVLRQRRTRAPDAVGGLSVQMNERPLAGRPSPTQATRRRKSCGDRRWRMRLRVEAGGFIGDAEDNVLRYFNQ